MSTAAPAPRKSEILVAEPNELQAEKRSPRPRSAAGLLVMDSSLSLVSFNTEAMQILSYPGNIENLAGSEILLTEKIRSSLIAKQLSREPVFVRQFRSGRRRYFCRAFVIDSHNRSISENSIVVLLERSPSGFVPWSQLCQQFKLTKREQEVLGHLLQGMSSRGIANRMSVSPNTVKAFLRLIMIKMGVSSRTEVICRIMMTQR